VIAPVAVGIHAISTSQVPPSFSFDPEQPLLVIVKPALTVTLLIFIFL
jgi:hypothetical protein